MTLPEVDRALRRLRLSGMADAVEARLRHAQAERLAPLDLVATLVTFDLQMLFGLAGGLGLRASVPRPRRGAEGDCAGRLIHS